MEQKVEGKPGTERAETVRAVMVKVVDLVGEQAAEKDSGNQVENGSKGNVGIAGKRVTDRRIVGARRW